MQQKFRIKSTKELNDLIDGWHESSTKKELHEHLGLSRKQFGLLIKDPDLFVKKYNIIENDA